MKLTVQKRELYSVLYTDLDGSKSPKEGLYVY